MNTVDAERPSDLDELTHPGRRRSSPPADDRGAGVDRPAAPASGLGRAAAGGGATTRRSTRPRRRPGAGDTVTVLADSVLLGAEDALEEELGADGYMVDYRGRPALMLHQSNDDLEAAGTPVGDTVVIGLGHNTLWERDRARLRRPGRRSSTARPTSCSPRCERLGAEADRLGDAARAVASRSSRRRGASSTSSTSGTSRTSTSASTRSSPAIPRSSLADWAAVSNEAGRDLRRHAPHVDGIRLMIDTIRAAGAI